MLFSSKSDAALYFEYCLINPKKMSGIWSDEQFFWEAIARPTIQETEAWLGDLLASNLQRKVLGDFIWVHLRDKSNPKKTRDLDKAVLVLSKKIQPSFVQILWAVSEFHLNKQNIGVSGLKGVLGLLELKDENVIHQSEYGLLPKYSQLRHNIISQVPDSWIEKTFRAEVESVLGIKFNFNI